MEPFGGSRTKFLIANLFGTGILEAVKEFWPRLESKDFRRQA